MGMQEIRGEPAHPQLPPGFRFHPTDEELLIHYLKNKLCSSPLPLSIIADVDLYKFDPWDLPGMARFGEQEWYFFSPRERKYPNGTRPNRTAVSGYWKATGIDKPVVISGGSHKVGVKKGLVFYTGRPPKGVKTDWIMHEYRLTDPILPGAPAPPAAAQGRKESMRLDEWVLCRIFKRACHLDRGESAVPHKVQEELPLPTTPTFTFGEDYNLLHSLVRKKDENKHLLPSTNLKRKLSIVLDGDIDDLYPPKARHNNNSFYAAPLFKSAYPYEDPILSDFHQICSLPLTENTLWNTESETAWLS